MVQEYGGITMAVRWTDSVEDFILSDDFTHLLNQISSLLCIVFIPEVSWKKSTGFCNLMYYCFHLLFWKAVGKTDWFTAHVKCCWNMEHRCTRAKQFFSQLITIAERKVNSALISIFEGLVGFSVVCERKEWFWGCLGVLAAVTVVFLWLRGGLAKWCWGSCGSQLPLSRGCCGVSVEQLGLLHVGQGWFLMALEPPQHRAQLSPLITPVVPLWECV